MIPLNYHHLYYFYVIAKEGSISKACARLLLAQPTLSSQLKQFERAMGHPMFARHGRRLFLTGAGRHALGYAESIFELGREFQDTLKGGALPAETGLRMGAVAGLAQAFRHSFAMAAFEGGVERVGFEEGSLAVLTQKLLDHQLDLALSDERLPGLEERLVSRLVGSIPLALAATPRLAARYKTARDLHGAPLILPKPDGRLARSVLDWLAMSGVKPRVVAEVGDEELARRLGLSGAGIVPLNEHTLAVSQPHGALVSLGIRLVPTMRLTLYLSIRRRKWKSPFIDALFRGFRIG